MKRVFRHMMSRQFISLVLSSLLLFFVFSVIPPEIEELPPQPEVVVVEKPKWVHILSTWELSKLYSYKEDPNMDTTINLTTPEAVALMKIGRCEGGDSVDGQAAVMAVIINRIKTDKSDFKDIETVGQAIFQDGQFSTVDTGAFDDAQLNTNSHLALAKVECGIDITDGALWFESASNSDNSWHKQNLTFICEIEGNLYYR